MSKLCMQTREERRSKLTKKFFLKRKGLRKIINDINTSMEAKELAQKNTKITTKTEKHTS